MIVIEQVRAARAMLNWKLVDLAEASGLSLNTLSNLETGQSQPTMATLHAIKTALEKGGVEFLPGHGVRPKGELFEMEKFEGPDLVARRCADMLESIERGEVKEILFCFDNARFARTFPHDMPIYHDFVRKLDAVKFPRKVLMREGLTDFPAAANYYRWAPAQLLGEINYSIYGDTVQLILWGPPQRLVYLRNPGIAETFRRQFMAIWKLATPVPKTIFAQHHRAHPINQAK